MKKVFIAHGFQGSPSGGWRPWLMAELENKEIYACALPMPNPDAPVVSEWVDEIARVVDMNPNDEICLVGHSLGVPAILRYLEGNVSKKISKAVLVSGPSEKNGNPKIENFLEAPFNFEVIKNKVDEFYIIHGVNDPVVPFANAETLASELGGKLITVENGGHLNGSSGWRQLPQALEVLI